MRLTRPSERAAALHVLLPRLTTTLGGLLVDSADVSVVPARWDFAQLDEWRRYLDHRVGTRGLVSLSTDPVANRIDYGVTTWAARFALGRRLRALRVPCGLVKIRAVGVPRAM
jgi:hypothetical protein